jgi:hypothetical protein
MALPSSIQKSVGNQARQVLVQGSRFQAFDQVRQRHFWSTYRFTTDVNGFIKSGDFDIFQTPQGQQGQGFIRQLSLLETNWPSSNRVPDNQNFVISELGCSATMVFIDPSNPNSEAPFKVDWNNYAYANQALLDNTILNITYLTNTVPLGLCSDFAQAAGPTVGFYAPNAPQAYPLPNVDNNAPTDMQRNFTTNGFAAPGLRRRFKIPILLQHGETFKFTLSVSPGRGPFMLPFSAGVTLEDLQNFAFDLRMDFWATESFVENS